MDVVQKQVIALTHKVDALYQIIEQLDSKVTAIVEPQSGRHFSNQGATFPGGKQDTYRYYSPLDSVMEHKDVLVDGGSESLSSRSSSEKDLSTEIQIQRLTAQLTAAYNRIAALEEQLLARRVH